MAANNLSATTCLLNHARPNILTHEIRIIIFCQQTTRQFYSEYKERLQKLNLSSAPNITAYTYDALWTVAASLNKSIPVLEGMGLNLQDFYQNKTEITNLFVQTIQDIHFLGVTVGLNGQLNGNVTQTVWGSCDGLASHPG